MKKYFFFLMLAVSMNSCKHEHDHDHVKAADESISPSAIAEALKDRDSLFVTVKARIVETCANAGCWLTLENGTDEPLLVKTQHEFFVPLHGCAGFEATVEGVARKVTQSVDEQRHLLEDAASTAEDSLSLADRQAAITSPRDIYRIDATSVSILFKKPEVNLEHDHDGDGVPDHEPHEHDHEHDHDHEHGEVETKPSSN